MILPNEDDDQSHNNDNLKLDLDHYYEDVRLSLTWRQKVFIALLSVCVGGGALLILGKGHCHRYNTYIQKYRNTTYRNTKYRSRKYRTAEI